MVEIGYLNKSVKKANCKYCDGEIPKQTLRISCDVRGYNHLTTHHYHLKCYLEMLESSIEERKQLKKEILKHKKEMVIQEL